MTASFPLLGGAFVAALLAGYFVQWYGLPPPKPKIAGLDLGTTFSSIGLYQAVTGDTDIVADDLGKRSVPSVVAFLPNGTVLVGTKAVEQQEHNPRNTIYDAKRFIGKTFSIHDPQFQADLKRYPFTIKLDETGRAYFEVKLDSGVRRVTPEQVGSYVIAYLRAAAERKCGNAIPQLVLTVPAEFGDLQRNYTGRAAELAGMEVRRIISEPTAAALSYGLHKKKGVEYILVVDLGGGTLDVSLLWLQGGVFVTQAMAGNNRLGGQDFNERVQKHLLAWILDKYGAVVSDKDNIQQIRMAIEVAKVKLTTDHRAVISLNLDGVGDVTYELTRKEFEALNADLFDSIIEPIEAALADAELTTNDIDEIVLVGGSTRVPRVRQIVGTYFGKAPNFGIDPELAVVTGATVQAGVVGGGWPLQVTAMELPTDRRKIHIYTHHRED